MLTRCLSGRRRRFEIIFTWALNLALTRSKSKLLIEDLEKMDLRFDHFNLLPPPPLPQNWIFSLMTSIILDLRFDHLSKPPPPKKQGSHSTWKTWKNESTPGKPGNIMEFWKI